MDIPIKKLTNGFSLPVYGLGTWRMGGAREKDASRDSEELEALQNALEHGVTHIDTAELYGGGHTEELVGQAIKGYRREQLQITSKVLPEHLAYDDVFRSLEGSLRRLKIDYLDLYLIHAPNPSIPLKETLRALNNAVRQGLIRSIGVSNFRLDLLQEAKKLSEHQIVCNQVHYNLRVAEVEQTGVLRYCQDHDMLLIAYRPVQRGALAHERNVLLDDIASRYSKTPAQIALNWLISQKNIVTVAKTSSSVHLEENLGALGWQLSPEDIERLRKEFPDRQPFSDVPAAMGQVKL